ncbi:alpha/beta fold hydrolase [Acidipila rosea]|uniref:Homoserine O-acetyltransferase n=1 Tax=Acidipila rosea TaxID=768535 RepID=A0A4R1LC02_9BACT|nr:alpha/beta fold hydrolase [Acidipila rosea]TCK75097.1 homoserine O-acetyltransferase [Acidipila rosea]
MKKSLLSALALCLATVLHAQAVPPLQHASLGDLKLQSGQTIHDCTLAYRAFGKLNAAKSNVVLYPMWFTGRSGDASGNIGAGRLVDDSKYYILVLDPLGDGFSCSPSNSTTQHGVGFPHFTIRDMVDAEHRFVTESLHLTHVHAVMGISMGGMQTFQWMVSYPTFMDAAVPIVGTPQLTSYDEMLWNSEKLALKFDPAWQGGRYTTQPKLPIVALIHDMNLTTPEFRVDHTTREMFPGYFERLTTEGRPFDANDYLYQLNAMLTQDITAGGSIYDAAAKVKARTLIINASQDHMVNPIPALAFAKLIHAQTVVLDSDCGHSSPGCDMGKLSPIIDSFLAAK